MKEIKGRIVIVDDDHEMRSLLEDFFSNDGYAVTVFPIATEALRALSPGGKLGPETEEGDVDAVISDIKMPQMDGLEFTQRMQTARPEVPIILITAFGSIETAIEAMRRGAFHYVVKPFKLAEMVVNVERAVVLTQTSLIDETDIPSPETASAEQFFAGATADWPSLDQLERRYIEIVLEKTAGRRDKAAQILGINRRTLYRKEREYGLISDETPEPMNGEGASDADIESEYEKQ